MSQLQISLALKTPKVTLYIFPQLFKNTESTTDITQKLVAHYYIPLNLIIFPIFSFSFYENYKLFLLYTVTLTCP